MAVKGQLVMLQSRGYKDYTWDIIHGTRKIEDIK